MSTTNKMPPGIPYIIGNEAAERYSYYGMRSILVIFKTKYLMDRSGALDTMTPEEAKGWYHLFGTATYFLPLIGALVSDIFWGKYRTIITLSLVYCLGHLTLALDETRLGLSIGLTLIAIGAGGIKPCVSAHVGDQFDESNKGLLERVFGYFYFSINFGAFASIFLTPILLEKYGPSVAFGIPGILMFIATIFFWAGRNKFIAVPAAGWKKYRQEVLSKEGLKSVATLAVLYFFIAGFWSLFEQQGSSWVLQADQMDRLVDLRFGPFQYGWLQFELLASQISAVNPVLIMIMIPLFSFVIYPLWNRVWKVTPLRKIGVGLALAAFSFVIVALAQEQMDQGHTVSILWQFAAYVILTAAEVMVSITSLEYSYTQAPNAAKSFIMTFYLLSVSLGNSIAAAVNFLIQGTDGTSAFSGASYFWFFVVLTFVFTIGFVIFAIKYKEKSFIQPARAN